MTFLAFLFVAKPFNILIVAVLFFSGYLWQGSTKDGSHRRLRSLLIASIAWLLYAGWELLVLIRTPEANIRVDLLVIWPVLAILSIWAILSFFMRRR